MKPPHSVVVALTTGVALATTLALAHEGDTHPSSFIALPPPATLAQLEQVRHANARFLDVDQAVAEGYIDIGLFYTNMGWHYLKPALLDDTFEADSPELLVYADDPCSAKRRLVAVEYAVPVSLVQHAPAGFAGNADGWVINQQFQLWTLHAWLYEFNPAGVFASHNARMP